MHAPLFFISPCRNMDCLCTLFMKLILSGVVLCFSPYCLAHAFLVSCYASTRILSLPPSFLFWLCFACVTRFTACFLSLYVKICLYKLNCSCRSLSLRYQYFNILSLLYTTVLMSCWLCLSCSIGAHQNCAFFLVV